MRLLRCVVLVPLALLAGCVPFCPTPGDEGQDARFLRESGNWVAYPE
ncbi:hypothetical protein [Arenimonas sp.]|nr:hypothetical protein [Arenimonas sp.]